LNPFKDQSNVTRKQQPCQGAREGIYTALQASFTVAAAEFPRSCLLSVPPLPLFRRAGPPPDEPIP